ncbi:MAG: hypothetical protein Q4E03_04250 [Trueperella sp.]|nr:hypothetical protein [Trueperella sp.]
MLTVSADSVSELERKLFVAAGAELHTGQWEDAGGVALDPAAATPVLAQCDILDGLAKELQVVDTVAFTPMGDHRMSAGFVTSVGALSRVITRHLGADVMRGQRVAIRGGGALAACALAVAVEFSAADIFLIAPPTGGPGSAIAAAHRLGIDVTTIMTGSPQAAESPGAVTIYAENELAVQSPTGTVTGMEVLVARVVDQLRLFTGANPDEESLLATALAAVDN